MEPQLNECQIAADLRARVAELEEALEEIDSNCNSWEFASRRVHEALNLQRVK
jgi:hypothetical protein